MTVSSQVAYCSISRSCDCSHKACEPIRCARTGHLLTLRVYVSRCEWHRSRGISVRWLACCTCQCEHRQSSVTPRSPVAYGHATPPSCRCEWAFRPCSQIARKKKKKPLKLTIVSHLQLHDNRQYRVTNKTLSLNPLSWSLYKKKKKHLGLIRIWIGRIATQVQTQEGRPHMVWSSFSTRQRDELQHGGSTEN